MLRVWPGRLRFCFWSGAVRFSLASCLAWFPPVLPWVSLGSLPFFFGPDLVRFSSASGLARFVLVLFRLWFGSLRLCMESVSLRSGSDSGLAWFASVLLPFWLGLLRLCFDLGGITCETIASMLEDFMIRILLGFFSSGRAAIRLQPDPGADLGKALPNNSATRTSRVSPPGFCFPLLRRRSAPHAQLTSTLLPAWPGPLQE